MKMMLATTLLAGLFTLGLARPAASPTYENLNAVLWMQTAVEHKAATTQTYRLAQVALLQGLRDPHWTAALEQNGDFDKLPPAVILDLDETVLDNSILEARIITSAEGYTRDAWNKWMEERNAGLVPGAMDFLQFAHANGVTPIYITNRVCDSSKEDDSTVQNLRKLGVPLDSSVDRLLCAKDSKDNDKGPRRRLVVAKYRILLLFGDQLGDFLSIPASEANLAGREKLYEAHQSLWGERWFQLPNPMYGSWEAALSYTVPEKL